MRGRDYDTEDFNLKGYDWSYIRRLLGYAWPHRLMILVALGLMLVTTAAQLAVPYIFKMGIDNYIIKIYEVYSCGEETVISLTNIPGTANSIVRLDGTHVAIAQKALKKIPAASKTVLRAAEKEPGNYYLFPTNYYTGTAGYLAAGTWVVSEEDVSKVSPKVLKTMRKGDLHGVYMLAIALLGLLVIRMVTEYGHAVAIQIAGQRAMYDLRIKTFQCLQKLSMSYFTKNPVGRLVTRVTNDVEAINEVFASLLVSLIKDVLIFIGTIIIICIINIRLGLVAMVMLPVFVLITLVFRPRIRRSFRIVRKHIARINAALTEDISGVKIIQIFIQQARRHKEFKNINDDYYRANMHQMLLFSVFRPLIDLAQSTGTALVLLYGGWCIMSGSLTLGALVAFFGYLHQLYQPVISVSQQINTLQSAMAASERIFGVIDETPEIQEISQPVIVPEPKGLVAFENVCFSYIDNIPVLRDVSFTVEPGKSVAIVGPTGAGKSSIINLICRFYEQQTGIVRLDGVDVREWSFEQLSKHIAIVLQDAFIFSRDVQSNIRLGRTDIPREKILEAAEMVQARQFIEKLPGGFEEMMMERGSTLSSGQKQLLCFARALAHDPRLLILDEATSNVDPATEQLIQHAIITLMKGRTSIIVAHRLSTIQKVDEIMVLDNGRILERGSHQELMARRGIYYNLYLLQFSHAA